MLHLPGFFSSNLVRIIFHKKKFTNNQIKAILENNPKKRKAPSKFEDIPGNSRPWRVQSKHRFSVRFFYFDIFNCGPVPRLVIFCAFSSIRERGGRGTTQRTLFFSASLLQQMSHSHVPIKNSALRQSFFSFSALHDFLMFVHRLLHQTSVRVYCLYLAGSYK